MNKRRPKRISVLLIPDDNAEPYSFKLNLRLVRWLIVLAVVLVVHVLGGGYAYWAWYTIHKKNDVLEVSNSGLLDDNKRIYLLQDKLEDVNQLNEKLMALLGVPDEGEKNAIVTNSVGRAVNDRALKMSALSDELRSDVQPDLNALASRSSFLSRKSTELHDYTSSLPTLLPVEGFLSAEFSLNSWLLGSGGPGLGKRHTGIDIAGSLGKTILAAGSGMVVFAGWTSKFGNMIVVYHGEDTFSYYAHASRLLVSDRSSVRKGDPIAELGNSGSTSKGPHLHFEIWRNGQPVNPREYILAFVNEEN